MKKIMLGLLLAISMTTFTAPSFAQGNSSHQHQNFFERLRQHLADLRAEREQRRARPPVAAVPEIDAAGAGIALALAGGLFAVYRERRKSE